MGKARIIEHQGEGRYRIEIELDTARAESRIAEIDAKLSGLDQEILEQQAKVLEAQTEVDAIGDQLDAALEHWAALQTWEAKTNYAAGAELRVNENLSAVAAQAGRSGDDVPEWPAGHGETVRENAVTWSLSVDDPRGGARWSSQTSYAAGTEILARPNVIVAGQPGTILVDDKPVSHLAPESKNIYATVATPGRSGFAEPAWPMSGTVVDGGILWRMRDRGRHIDELVRKLQEKGSVRDAEQVVLDKFRLRRHSLRKERNQLEAHKPDNPTVDAWCADLTEDLAADTRVGTIEIPAERSGPTGSQTPVLVRPGYVDEAAGMVGAAHEPARDGQIQPTVSGRAWNVLVNQMLLPGVQRWRPQYRLGTLTALAGDTGDLVLDPAKSSAQALDVNPPAAALLSVPIRYMNCHGSAFQVGDRVLVEFAGRDWTEPRVIGFEKEPRACGPFIRAVPASDTGGLSPIELYYRQGWISRSTQRPAQGNLDWTGAAGDYITWRGPRKRHFPELMPDRKESHFIWNAVFWHRGKPLLTPGPVLGAAVIQADEQPYFVVITRADLFDQVYAAPVSSEPSWQLCADYEYLLPNAIPVEGKLHRRETPWFFSSDGTEAQCIRYHKKDSSLVRLKVTLTLQPEANPPVSAHFEMIETGNFLRAVESLQCSGDGSSMQCSGSYSYSGHAPIAVEYQGMTPLVAYLSQSGGGVITYAHNYYSENRSSGDRTTTGYGTRSIRITLPENQSMELFNDDHGGTHHETFGDNFSYSGNNQRTLKETEILVLDLRYSLIAVYATELIDSRDYADEDSIVFESSVVSVASQTIALYAHGDLRAIKTFSSPSPFHSKASYMWSTTSHWLFDIMEFDPRTGNPTGAANPLLITYKHYPPERYIRGTLLPYSAGSAVLKDKVAASIRCGNFFQYLINTIANNYTNIGDNSWSTISYLDDGDLVSITGITGDNPRFYPLGLV